MNFSQPADADVFAEVDMPGYGGGAGVVPKVEKAVLDFVSRI